MLIRFGFSRFALAIVLLLAGGIAAAQEDFTIAVLPDTQFYAEQYPAIFTAQTEWLAANASVLNLKLVLGVGDIVNDGDSTLQWTNADQSIKVLESAGIPYMLAIGNHDYKWKEPYTRSAENFNEWFGPKRYAGQSWYKGNYPSGSNENFFGLFTFAGRDYLVLALEFYPRQEVLQWASQVLSTYPDRFAILVTHGYLGMGGARISQCEWNNAEYWKIGQDNDGQEMWQKFVSRQGNLRLVLSGHVYGAASRADLNDSGKLVNQLLVNFQHETNGGNGYLRLLKFRPSQNLIEATTFSPTLNAYRTDSKNQFSVPIEQAGTVTGTSQIQGTVKSGSDCREIAAAKVSHSFGSAISDSSGRYSLTASGPQALSLVAEASGFQRLEQTVNVWGGFNTQADFFVSPGSTESTCTTPSSPGVNICSPANGAAVTSPVGLKGVAASSFPVIKMELWVDGGKYTLIDGDRIDVSVPLGTGNHLLSVYGIDSAWNKVNSRLTVAVGTAGCSPPLTPDVNICSPASSAPVKSPVAIKAAATSASPVTNMELWIDGKKQAIYPGSLLEFSASLSPGNHLVSIYGIDASRQKVNRRINVEVLP